MNDLQTNDATAFANLVNGTSLDCRTGIVLLPHYMLGQEKNLAVNFNAHYVDYQAFRLEHMPEKARVLRLTTDLLKQDLARISVSDDFKGKPSAFVANVDLGLAYLAYEKRNNVWRFLRSQLRKHPVGLFIALPEGAKNILPNGDEYRQWLSSNRLITLS